MGFKVGNAAFQRDSKGASSLKLNAYVRNEKPTGLENTSADLNSKEAVKIIKQTNQTGGGKSAQVSSVQGFLEASRDAASKVADLRSQQLSLANRASELQDGNPELSSLDQQAQEIQKEIDSISQAKYNDQPVLAGGTFSYSGDDGTPYVTSIPDFSAITRDLSLSLTTPDGAQSAASTLEEESAVARQAATSTGVAADSTQARTKPDSVSRRPEWKSEQLSYEDASDLASRVAHDISSKYSPSSPDTEVMRSLAAASHKINSNRAKGLLVE